MSGRPKSENPLRAKMTIRITEQEEQAWQEKAKASGLTVGEWVRRQCGRAIVEPKESFAVGTDRLGKPEMVAAPKPVKTQVPPEKVVGASDARETVVPAVESTAKPKPHIYAQFNNEVAPSKHKWSTPPNPPKSVPNIPGVVRGSDLTKGEE